MREPRLIEVCGSKQMELHPDALPDSDRKVDNKKKSRYMPPINKRRAALFRVNTVASVYLAWIKRPYGC